MARLCTSGEGHGRAAPYKGEAPHPAVLFTESGIVAQLATAGPGHPEPTPEEVQVVGCVGSADRSAPEPAGVCPYRGGHAVRYFPATYRIEVYEARTARRLGALEATDPRGCAVSEIFPEDERHRERNLTPSDKRYEKGLADFFTGPARWPPTGPGTPDEPSRLTGADTAGLQVPVPPDGSRQIERH